MRDVILFIPLPAKTTHEYTIMTQTKILVHKLQVSFSSFHPIDALIFREVQMRFHGYLTTSEQSTSINLPSSLIWMFSSKCIIPSSNSFACLISNHWIDLFTLAEFLQALINFLFCIVQPGKYEYGGFEFSDRLHQRLFISESRQRNVRSVDLTTVNT